MLNTTLKVVRASLDADPSVPPAERVVIMSFLRNGTKAYQPEAPKPFDTTPRIVRRHEVAKRLACSLRTVDKLPLKKVKLPGRVRAAGFLESDVNALLA